MSESKIDVVERFRRQEAIDEAKASVELSGHRVSQEVLDRAQLFVDGLITMQQFVEEIPSRPAADSTLKTP